MTPETLAMMSVYHWPGNVRELENLMERMVILADGPILTKEDLPQRLRQAVEFKIEPDQYQDSQPSLEDEKPIWPDFSKLGSEDNFPDQPCNALPNTGQLTNTATKVDNQEPTNESNLKTLISPDLYALLEPIISFPPSGVDLNLLVSQFEDHLIKAALQANGQVKNLTAKALGLNRTTFLEKLKKKGL
jgi:DNA-binding NtrC family response regulator